MRRAGFGLLLVAALIGWTGSASAEVTASELYVGLAGAYRAGTFTPVTVTLSNDSSPVEGLLRVTFRDASGAKGAYEKAVRLPNGSRKRVTLYPRPGGTISRLNVSLVDGQENVLWETEERLVLLQDQLRIIGYVGTSTAGNPGIRAIAGKRTRVLVLDPAELPDTAAGYETLDALILREPDMTQLTPPRVNALKTWVSSGGTLVLAVATRAQDVAADTSFESLLPARLGAIETVSAKETGLTSDDSSSVPMVRLSPLRGNAVWGVGGRPEGVAGAYGNGRVAVLGFDPASVTSLASRKQLLWERLLEVPLPPEPPNVANLGGYYSGYQTDPRALILSHVGEMPPLKPPPMALMILLLALYVFAVGPGDYLLLKKLGKLQWTWFTYPATILLFSGAVYAYAKFSRSERVEVKGVAVVDLAAVPPDAPAPGRAVLGIYAPTGDDYTVTVRSPGAQASAFSADTTSLAGMAWQIAKNQEWVGRSDSTSASVTLPVPQWSFGAAEVVGVAESPPRFTAARVGGNEVALTHGGGGQIVGMAVVSGGYARVYTEKLDPGGTTRMRLPNASNIALSTINPYDSTYGYYNGQGNQQGEETVLRKALLRVAHAGNPPLVEYSLPQGGVKKVKRERGTPFLQRSVHTREQPIVLAAVAGSPFDLDIAGQGDRGMLTIYRVPVQHATGGTP